MIQIKKATVLPEMDGWLLVNFSNGSKKFVDIKPHMDGVLEQLRDPAFFKQVSVDEKLKTVTWPGELGLDPDQLYEEGIELKDIKKWIELNKG
ncbi:hypothetical protein AS034_13000 [[Bacillus] enclensis]|uniref:DUF2442 domain-containing protein n=1 Tax=[Bacillus] enclensis TaxID=1402860 RepID=A0A0V8HGL3_9BACI|nr:DUF2442 domain-containing protein [[Bacillus] enclensis]KSU61750.1 hypothetical protein AS034_13000 [[Bacillus] enclensis]SCC14782.1 Protein of unknown function [[Bacillus] enclensis]